jgi:polyisoprenoid-binding protein YceI
MKLTFCQSYCNLCRSVASKRGLMSKLILFLCTTAALMPAATWQIDSSHSNASFSVRHMMVSNVRGAFSKVAGTVDYDPKNPMAMKINATIDVTTIDTRDQRRDDHLKSADFFDVAKFPSMTFVSRNVVKKGKGYIVNGDLTLHGVTKPVALSLDGPAPEIKDPYGNMRTGATATTVVNRKDFGLAWSKLLETGGAVVGDEVTITLELEATRKP